MNREIEVRNALAIAELVRRHPESLSRLPSPFAYDPEGAESIESIRAALERHIAYLATHQAHQALQVYANDGITLDIFQNYDIYKTHQGIMNPRPHALLTRDLLFPNTLKPVACAIAGYESHGTNEEFKETVQQLIRMGAGEYLTDAKYVAKMANHSHFHATYKTQEKTDRTAKAVSYLMELGMSSLTNLLSSEKLHAPTSFDMITSLIKDSETAIGQNKLTAAEFKTPYKENLLIDAMHTHERSVGIRHQDPHVFFKKLMVALYDLDLDFACELVNGHDTQGLFKSLLERNAIELTVDEIVMRSKETFTPLRMLRVLEASNPAKSSASWGDSRKTRAFEVLHDAGLHVFFTDERHFLAMMKDYRSSYSNTLFELDQIKRRSIEVGQGLKFPLAIHMARLLSSSTPIAGFSDHVQAQLRADKAGSLQSLSTDDADRLFGNTKAMTALGLVKSDAFFTQSEKFHTSAYKGRAIEDDLGL